LREVTLESLVDFVRLLRGSGFRIGVSESIDAYRAVEELGLSGDLRASPQKIAYFREALRVTLAKDPDRYGVFDELFDMYWLMGLEAKQVAERRIPVRVEVEGETPDPVKKFLSIYSPLDIRGRIPKDVEVDPRVRGSVRRNIRMIAKKIPTKPGARRKRSSKGEISFPQTYREALSTLGDIVKLVKTRRKAGRADFIFLIDVSGSMEDTWASIASLLRAVKGLPARSYEVFLFSTDLIRATEAVQIGEGAVKDLLARSGIWGSGTRIGESLYKLVSSYRGLLGDRSIVVIISDGWDLGDLTLLERSLRDLRRSVSRILWLSPYAGKRGFAPDTMCLRIAVRYVDAILPAEILYDALTFKRYLRTLLAIR